MENIRILKKYFGRFFVFILMGTFLFSADFVFAYDNKNAHPALTKEAVNLFNSLNKDKISNSQKEFILQGSVDEDFLPRPLNHFYDPINKEGLGGHTSAEEWAQDSNLQTNSNLALLINRDLSFYYALFNPEKLRETDYSWQRALEDYVNGKEDRAFEDLGHILHLIEDMGVPDHTRNDAHPLGSVYEVWASRWNKDNLNVFQSLINLERPNFNNLNEAFDYLADFSNKNFFSEDTINKNYSKPTASLKETGYGYGIININKYINLVYFHKDQTTGKVIVTLQDDNVLSDYWKYLSKETILTSAGVIDLFFREAEKAKNDPNFIKNDNKPVFSQLIDAIKGVFNKVADKAENYLPEWNMGSAGDNNLKLAAVIDLNDGKLTIVEEGVNQTDIKNIKSGQETIIENQKTLSEKSDNKKEDFQDEDLAEAESKKKADEFNDENEPIQINVATNEEIAVKQPKICTFDTNKILSHQNLIINEVAWMGGANSANDEWFELKNISGSELDVSGWQVLDKKEDIKIVIDSGTKISSSGLLLFERTDDNSISDIKADFIYSGALSNSDEGLRVFDSECNLTDEVLADSSWPAGEASSRRTMERQSDFSWKVYSGNGENGIFGTPKKENSQLSVSSGSGVAVSNSAPAEEALADSPPKIIISEVQISGATASDDFIELFNAGNKAVDLTGWSIKRKSSSGTESTLVSESRLEGKSIPAKGYFLTANDGGYSGSVAADVPWPKTYSLATDNAILLYAPDKSIAADKVGFGKAQDFESAPALNPAAGQTISRVSQSDTDNNANDFILSNPTPKNSSASGEFLSPSAWSSGSPVSSVGNLLISEIFIDMDNQAEEFVEIYNPNDSEISFRDWSLQYLSGGAASFGSIEKKYFASNSVIKPKQYYLVGMGNYQRNDADMLWSQSLNNTGATVFLVSATTTISGADDSSIIDRIAYGTGSGILLAEGQAANLPPAGQSLERKPFSNNACISVSEGGVLGNGCDTDDNSVDFEVRTIRGPQNSQNFPEPRNAPTIPANLNISYDVANLKANLAWGESGDFSGATSTMKYVISYATSSQIFKELGTVNSANSYEFFPKEIEIDSQYSVVAKDKEGMLSEAGKINLNAPDFLSDLNFYKDATSSDYYIDLNYDKYPFVPDVYDKGSTWKTLVFYLNQDAPDEIELNTQNNWTPENISGVLKVVYKKCSGGSYSPGFSLILPDSADRCSAGGGIGNSALDFNEIKDNHLPLKLDLASTTVFTNQDFVTVGYYSFFQSGGGSQKLRVAALSRKKYFFSE